MNEDLNTPQLPQPAPSGKSPVALATLVGLGAAVAAAPLVTYAGYRAYKQYARASQANDRALAKAFDYDLTKLRKIDPALIKYKELGRIETTMQSPRAIAVDPAGNLLVAGDRTVKRFIQGSQPTDLISLSQAPFCLAAAPDGTIFVGLKDHVEIYGPDGKQKAAWNSFGPRSYLTCIAVSGDNVWVADAGRRLVMRCTLDGKVLKEIGKPDDAKAYPGLIVPSPHLDVAVASDGLVWVTNPGMHRMEAYTADGQLERVWGVNGTGVEEFFGCCNPTDFSLLSDGSFITAEKGIARIKRYSGDGRFDCAVAGPDAFAENMIGLDLATTKDGNVFVMERNSRTVRIFAPITGGAS